MHYLSWPFPSFFNSAKKKDKKQKKTIRGYTEYHCGCFEEVISYSHLNRVDEIIHVLRILIQKKIGKEHRIKRNS